MDLKVVFCLICSVLCLNQHAFAASATGLNHCPSQVCVDPVRPDEMKFWISGIAKPETQDAKSRKSDKPETTSTKKSRKSRKSKKSQKIS